MDKTEQAKKRAAFQAVDEVLSDRQVVGIGSGSTVVYAVERIAERVRSEDLKITCVPTSFQARELIINAGLQLSDISQHSNLDVAFDGADEVDSKLNAIKGGGGCHLQEKIVAHNAKLFIIVADFRKKSKFLCEQWKRGIPVEVLPLAYVPVMKHLKKLNGKPTLRKGVRKAGPVVTDNGNFVVDVDFGILEPDKLQTIDIAMHMIPGVIETGLFVGMADRAYFGMEDGSVVVI
uniref:Ribose-5-phosphate isomerase n=1 Tax=Hirondellea gigas TaxID=1518452 RepID=A0A2P2I9X7_9CRUS